jgi:hypothetical protein
MLPTLGDVQRLLYRLVTAPNGVEEGLAAESNLPPEGIGALIRGDARVSAIGRVEIYANMYFHRLLDAIKEDFPATSKVLGDLNFHNLVTGYLVEYPPGHPSITEASLHLAEFMSDSPLLAQWQFVVDLVRLERALVEVFLGPDDKPLGFDDLRAIPPERWPGLRIGTHPALAVLDCGWQVDKVLRAVEQEQPFQAPIREPRSILVWRKNHNVYYRALDEVERSAFEMIRRGTEFSAVCEAIAAETGESTAPETMNRMLSRWLEDGVLVRRVTHCSE